VGNTIIPVSGRGIDVDGYRSQAVTDGQIRNNYVEVQERLNREYFTRNDVKALRLRDDVDAQGPQRNLWIHDNTFIAKTAPGMSTRALGVNISYLNPTGQMNNANIRLEQNTIKALVLTDDPKYRALALVLDGIDAGIGLGITRNVLESNDTSLV